MNRKGEDAIFDLVKNVASVTYEDLSPEAINTAKQYTLDVLGIATAGSSAPGCRQIVDLVKQWGGNEESTVLSWGCRVPAPHAALANSTMSHALDFDDTYEKGPPVHVTSTVIPAALAVAENKGNNGRELITAIVLGIDVTCRLAQATKVYTGWHTACTFGIFGASAACGKILGLNKEKLLNALGIAYSRAAGNIQCVLDGGLMKRIQVGFTSQGAVVSALLADSGITGAMNVLEGKAGFFKLYYNEDEYDREKLLNGLGQRFEIVDLTIKPYPCCRGTHASIDATLDIIHSHDINPDDVAEVAVTVPPFADLLLTKPFEIGVNPQIDAQFSIPYTVATAIIKRDVTAGDFFEDAIRDTRVYQMTKKVRVLAEPSSERGRGMDMNLSPSTVVIAMRDGTTYSKHLDMPSSSSNLWDMKQCVEKFRKCVRYGIRPMPELNVNKAIDMVANLEKVGDIGELLRLFA